MDSKKFIIALVFSMVMLGSAFALSTISSNTNSNETGVFDLSSSSNFNPTISSSVPWQMPTTTMNEPGYTNGTFTCGIDCNVGDLNPLTGFTCVDLPIYSMIYSTLYITMPGGQIEPWLATGYTLTHVSSNNKTFDIETNSMVNYSYIYNVNLRQNVQWTDWSKANASQTYTFSNKVQFNNGTGVTFTHTYTSYSPTIMKKYYLQSADVVLSWRLESALGKWPGVVNVVPNGNLSVKIYVKKPTVLILSNSLQSYILPYHIWIHHDFTSVAGLFNYTPRISSGEGYYGWNLNWNTATGSASGLVGDGPFMINNGYGMPKGAIIPSHYNLYYVNPHFFVQYANESSGLRQYTPKIYELYVPYYSSQSSMVAAFTKGQLDILGVSPPFLSLVEGTPGAYIYSQAGSNFCAVRIDENKTVAPLNITTFRQALNYATPYSSINVLAYDGLLTTTANVVPPSNYLWYNSSSPQYSYNLAKARELIKNIPGMSNVSGILMYNGKPVSIQLQIGPGSVTPCFAEVADELQNSWAALGITTTIEEEAYTTLYANVGSDHYQIAMYCQGTQATGDPACFFADWMNKAPAYFSIGCTLGPFTSLDFNGKHLTGVQVTNLLNNYSNYLLSSDSLQQSIKIAKLVQTIITEEAVQINLGYPIERIAFQTNQFTNFTKDNSKSHFNSFFTLLEIYKTKSTTLINYKYNLKVEEKFSGSLVERAGDNGSILYTVYNETTGLPVQGASIGISTSSVAKGLVNITPNQLKTNSEGKATWKFKVFTGLNNLLQTQLPNCNVINLPNEEVNISATVNPPSTELHTSTTSTYLNIELLNTNEKNYLQLKSKYIGNSHLYSSNSGSIEYTVSNTTGSNVSDANITVVISGIPGTITSKTFSFNTSTSNNGSFNFTVSSVLPKVMQTFDSSGNPMYLYYQEVNISAVASVGNQNQTGAGTTYNDVFIMNPSLVMSYSMNSQNYTSGETGSITFKVTQNGTAVSGAFINITSMDLKGIKYNKDELNMRTNTDGIAVFTFYVENTTTGSGSYSKVNETLVVKASTSNSTVIPATNNVTYSVSEKVVKTSTTSFTYIIIGVIAAVVIVGGAALYIIRKTKTPKK